MISILAKISDLLGYYTYIYTCIENPLSLYQHDLCLLGHIISAFSPFGSRSAIWELNYAYYPVHIWTTVRLCIMLLCHIMYEQMNNPLLTRWVSARYICDETSTFVYQHLAMVCMYTSPFMIVHSRVNAS